MAPQKVVSLQRSPKRKSAKRQSRLTRRIRSRSSLVQRKPPEKGRFRLQVDRQTKRSYATREAAEEASLAIKRAYPILHVAVFDAEEGQSTAITLPEA